MKTGFHDRVTLCSSCGAPLQAASNARATRCTKCGAENVVVARVDDAISEGWSEGELARVSHLRTQSTSAPVHPSIQAFVAGLRLSRAHAAQAFHSWQHFRSHIDSLATEEAFTRLTLLLAWRAAEESDPYRERGLLESALAVVRAPGHANQLRAALAILACRMRDLDGAESWLRTCDPRPVDLRSDSAYRFARAFVDTARGDLSKVLVGLGGNDVEIPIVDELAGPAALLRANAWERLGRKATALELLLHYKFEGNPFGQQLARSFLRMTHPLELCPTSEPEAERQRALTLGRRRIGWTAGMVVVFGLGAYFAATAGVAFALGVVSTGSAARGGDMASWWLMGFVFLFMGCLFFALFVPAFRRKRHERALLHRGQLAPARCQPGATVIGRSPGEVLVDTRAWVAPDHEPPFEKRITLKTNAESVDEFLAGTPFTVRYLAHDFLIEPQLR
jgi:hypothetical protein